MKNGKDSSNSASGKLLHFRLNYPIIFATALVLTLSACSSVSTVGTPQGTITISGNIQGGQQPISGAAIQLYAVGSTGNGAAATALLSSPVYASADGSFSVTEPYACPADSPQIYVVASGGNTVASSGTENKNAKLMALAGTCSDLSKTITVNEITTIGAVSALAPYMTSATAIGVNAGDIARFSNAVTVANELVNFQSGAVSGPQLPAGSVAPTTKINSLANILAGCVNSSGGEAGDGSACGSLFLDADGGKETETAVTNTVDAMMQIAKNPTRDVVAIYELSQSATPFEPFLTSVPADWTLPIIAHVAAPTFDPAPGTYSTTQSVTLQDSTPSAVIYYTTDGSIPTTASTQYSGEIQVSASATIRAIAVVAGLSSSAVSGAYTVSNPVTISMTPISATLAPSQAEAFSATVANTTDTAVTWSISPSVGSISAAGVYTAPASVTSAQTVSVTATSVANTAKAAKAVISLTPPISVSITPTTASLYASQTEAFSAAVANTTNTAVTWSISPAIGTISSTGLYTAPASVTSAQTVSVTATSVTNTAKAATAVISLTPPISVSITPTSASLTVSQTEAFTATVANTSNTAVTWSISPAVGTISSTGLYTAPASVTSAQTVSVTATSVANTAKTATAVISLTPPVTVSITPTSGSLGVAQNETFTAAVANSTNTAVTWSISPAVGTISPTGLYTAPTSIAAAQNISVIATSVADTAKSATAVISLTPPSGTTYYVSNSGNDSNNGKSASTPWLTIAHVNAQNFSPGDSILFQTGGTWREQLNIAWTGTSAASLNIGSYGTGAMPIISGGNVLSSWTSQTATEPTPTELCSNYVDNVTSVTCAATINATGSLLVVEMFTTSGEAATVTDTKGNTYTSVVTSKYLGGNGWVQTFYVPANNGSGADTITASVSTSNLVRIVALEWTGVASGSPLDGSNVVSVQSSGTSLSSGAASGSSSDTNDLVLGFCTAANTLAVGSGFTSIDNFQPAGINTLLQWKLGAGNSASTCSQSSSGQWSDSVVSFKAASVQAELYYTSASTNPIQVFSNGTRLTLASSKSAMTTGSWWYDSVNARIYVYDNPAGKTIEASQRSYAVYSACSSRTYLTVFGLQLQEAQSAGLYTCGGGVWTVYGVSALNNDYAGVQLEGPWAGSSVNYSTAAYNGGDGYEFYGSPNLLVAYDTAYNNVAISGNLYAAGIKFDPSTATTNAVVEYSTSYSNGVGKTGITGSGIWADTVGNGLIVRGNTVYNNNERGIDIDADNNALIYGNIAYNNLVAGIMAYADGNTSITGVQIYNNTIWGNGIGIVLQGPDTGSTAGGCQNNSITNNIVAASSTNELLAQYGCENPGTDGSGNTYTYNSLGAGSSMDVQWGGGTNYSTYAAWETAKGNCGATGCSHSMEANPMLTNPSAGVFTLQPGSPAIGAGLEGVDLGAIPHTAQ
jgi:hypothetical protein